MQEHTVLQAIAVRQGKLGASPRFAAGEVATARRASPDDALRHPDKVRGLSQAGGVKVRKDRAYWFTREASSLGTFFSTPPAPEAFVVAAGNSQAVAAANHTK